MRRNQWSLWAGIRTQKSISEVLKEVHGFLGSLFKNHITTTASAISISPEGEMSLLNCGGQGWFLAADENSKGIPIRGSLLGSETEFSVETMQVQLNGSERLFTFTDGIIDGTRSVMKLMKVLRGEGGKIKTNQELINLAIQIGEKDVHTDDKAMLIIQRAKKMAA